MFLNVKLLISVIIKCFPSRRKRFEKCLKLVVKKFKAKDSVKIGTKIHKMRIYIVFANCFYKCENK